MGGVENLEEILRSLRPELSAGTFVYCTVPHGSAAALGFQPVCMIEEQEGTTVVCALEDARGAGLDFVFPCRRITLSVHSSLEAVGLTAVVASRLSGAGISANVVAGYYHDHIYVPVGRADEAMAILGRLVG